MPEGFQCDMCKRFIHFKSMHHKIDSWTHHGWATECTFCDPCYIKVLDFIKKPHVHGMVI